MEKEDLIKRIRQLDAYYEDVDLSQEQVWYLTHLLDYIESDLGIEPEDS